MKLPFPVVREIEQYKSVSIGLRLAQLAVKWLQRTSIRRVGWVQSEQAAVWRPFVSRHTSATNTAVPRQSGTLNENPITSTSLQIVAASGPAARAASASSSSRHRRLLMVH